MEGNKYKYLPVNNPIIFNWHNSNFRVHISDFYILLKGHPHLWTTSNQDQFFVQIPNLLISKNIWIFTKSLVVLRYFQYSCTALALHSLMSIIWKVKTSNFKHQTSNFECYSYPSTQCSGLGNSTLIYNLEFAIFLWIENNEETLIPSWY